MSTDNFSQISTAVLAGARATGDPLCVAEGVQTKAIIDIDGRPMLAHVLETLQQSGLGEPSWLIGEDIAELRAAATGYPVRISEPKGAGPASSLLAALEGSVETPLLVTTCDHPLLSPEMVSHFLRQSTKSGADFTIALAPRAEIEAAHPTTKRTYLSIGGEDLSGCNLFYAATPEALKVLRFWQSVEHQRKKPWSIVWKFGLFTALCLLMTRNRPGATFRLLSKRLGARVEPVIMPFGEAAIDVDKPSDLEMVRDIFAKRRRES